MNWHDTGYGDFIGKPDDSPKLYVIVRRDGFGYNVIHLTGGTLPDGSAEDEFIGSALTVPRAKKIAEEHFNI